MAKYKPGSQFVLTLGKANYGAEDIDPPKSLAYEVVGANVYIAESVIDKLRPWPPAFNGRIRGRNELLMEPTDMTEEEKARLERIKSIPPYVSGAIEKRVDELRTQVANLERELDTHLDFLNGFW